MGKFETTSKTLIMRYMLKKETPLTNERIEKLLNDQTKVILNAVDEKLSVNEIRMAADVDRKLALMEERINRKFDKLTTTLDKFLNISQLKKIIQEKLGVNLA